MNKIEIDLLPNYYVKDNSFNLDDALLLGGKIAGICYSKNGFATLINESQEKTLRRVDMTINNGHHSVYDHIFISMNIKNIPKILSMVINNEKEYTTSEKSLRYTSLLNSDNLSFEEEELYSKWINIFKEEISKVYSSEFSETKILKLAQENARYLVSIFVPTEMIYTTSLRQINYLASWMKKYSETNIDSFDDFKKRLSFAMIELVNELNNKNLLVPGLLKNEKNRSFSLFGKDLESKKEYFDEVYQTNYLASYSEVAQAQRHRTINYQIENTFDNKFYIPPIIENNESLKYIWLNDISILKDNYPQGELVYVNERGTYEDFILKCKERLCSCAQIEINNITRDTLLKYRDFLKDNNAELYNDIIKYTKGARCTFPDYKCSEDCHFKEGKILTRKI